MGAGGPGDGLEHLGLVAGVVHHDDEALHPVLPDHLAQPQGADVLPLGGQLAHGLQKAVGHLDGVAHHDLGVLLHRFLGEGGTLSGLGLGPLEHLLLFLEQAHHGAPVQREAQPHGVDDEAVGLIIALKHGNIVIKAKEQGLLLLGAAELA